MSLRATFLLLLFANLAFFGWAALIDVSPEPTQSDSIGSLPRLKLLSEVRAEPSSERPAPPAPASAPAAAPASAEGSSAAKSAASHAAGSATPAVGAGTSPPRASGANGTAAGAASAISRPKGAANRAVSDSADPPRTVSTGVPVAATPGEGVPGARASGAHARGAGAPGAGAPGAAAPAVAADRRCITIGPFADPEHAREASDALRGRGFRPRGRTVASRSNQGYWVFVGGLKSSADQASVLQRLESNGISDAQAMPTSDAGRRVSVGLFSALDGAERRARAVRSLGLNAQVEPRPSEEVHWVDVDLSSSTQSLPAEGLLSLEEPGSRLEIKECPAPERGSGSRTLTAEGHPRPG